VFIAESNRVVSKDTKLSIRRKEMQASSATEEVKKLFRSLDVNGDNLLTWGEFTQQLGCPAMMAWASVLEVDTFDLERTFVSIAGGIDGQVGMEEFIEGVKSLKHVAKAADVATILRILSRIECGFIKSSEESLTRYPLQRAANGRDDFAPMPNFAPMPPKMKVACPMMPPELPPGLPPGLHFTNHLLAA